MTTAAPDTAPQAAGAAQSASALAVPHDVTALPDDLVDDAISDTDMTFDPMPILAEVDRLPEGLVANISHFITSGTNKRARLRALAAHVDDLRNEQDDRGAVAEPLCRGPLDASAVIPQTAAQWEKTLSEFETRRTEGDNFTAADRRHIRYMENCFAANYKRLLFVYFALEGDPLREALSKEAATVQNAIGDSLVDVDFVSDVSISQLVLLLADERESPYHFLHFSGHGHGDAGGKSPN